MVADIGSNVAAAVVPISVRDFVLDTTGRYQHIEGYVTAALLSAGFQNPTIVEAQIRIDDNEPIIGLAVVTKKSASIAKNAL